MKPRIAVLILGMIAWLAGNAHAETIAYVVPSGVIGNQTNGGASSFGMDFNVNNAISISQLGVFDSGQNGLLASIEAAIYDRTTGTLVSPIVTFAAGSGPGSGTLGGGSRFLSIAPITLAAGFQGSIIVFGYGDGVSMETDGNSFGAATGTPSFPWTTDSGGGLISFVGTGRFMGGETSISFPTMIDAGPANRYAAGTFVFSSSVVPEPSSLAMVGLGLLGAITLRGRRTR